MNISIEQKIVDCLKIKKWQISLAESCTGGKIVATLVNAKGTSKVLSQSYVTYSCDAKIKILGVKKDTLDCYNVYSKEVAKEMVEGLQKITKANICISVTGEAESSEPFCKCYYGIIIDNKIYVEEVAFKGTRNEVRRKQTMHILKRVYDLLS